jgi:hypothetical protein
MGPYAGLCEQHKTESAHDPPLSLDATLEGSPLVAAAKAIEEAKRELRWAERQLNTALADLQELLREFAA